MSPEGIHASSLAAAATYLDAFEAGDVTEMAKVLTDDVVHTLAMSFDGGTEPHLVLTGKDQVLGFFSDVLQQTSRRDLSDRRANAVADGEVVFIEAVGEAVLASTETLYRNVYVFKFECADGQVRRITEYANPVAAHKALHIPLG
ncbi:nuclear transport factor 2 family protein [Streptomyces canus]|uniref:nuclear transport factor 2 family protein n=1 Tax=Streptomyces canus TaxID=58343 RepID=UPI00099895E4|nr:nuclear transport factor 2 family protein [Streptomyces canus]